MFGDDNLIETDTLNIPNNWSGCKKNYVYGNVVPTTNDVKFEFKVEEVVQNIYYVSGHVIVNQCGSLLTRKNHCIIFFKSQKNLYGGFVQHRCVTPFHYFILKECSFLPFLFEMIPDDGSICGKIPSYLFSGIKSIHGFSNTIDHVESRLTSVSIATSKNITYESYFYDKLTNLSLNHEDTRIVLNRGLTVDPESFNGIVVICKNDSTKFESINIKQMVSSLCASQKYHKMDIFLTFTCN